jgi:tetratricopeptide (TPR) repeat protein
VAERKDVLSTFFWLLTLGAYSAYARRGGAARYAGVLAAFVLGLMSKAMLVTLPLVLLLLDYWPLGRFNAVDAPTAPAGLRSRLAPLVREKLPLFALTAVFSVIAFVAQRSWGATAPLDGFPLDQRLANALVSYAAYLGKMVYPASLAAFYPHPASVGAVVSPVAVVVAAAVLAVISAVVLAQRTTRPWLIAGWLWYVVTLVPVIGVVQIGAQAMADRYTYVPLIGIFVMLAWTIPAAVEHSRALRAATVAVAGAVLLALSTLATMQVGYWRDGAALYTHAIAVTKNNWLAWNNLGMQRLNAGDLTAALDCFAEAVRIKADYADGWYNAGVALLRLGRYPQAIAAYRHSLELEPNNADGWTNLGLAYVAQRDFRGALAASGRLRAVDPARSNELLSAIAAAMQAAPPATANVPRRTP